MKLHRILLAVVGAAVLTACDRAGTRTAEDPAAKAAEQREEALVRVIHAMPEAPQADVYTGDQKAFTDVKFGMATPYKPVSEERFKLTIRPAGQQQPVLIEANQGVDAGNRYTILAMPDRDGAAKIDVVTDEIEAPPTGKALVRIIHAAPEAGSVDLYTAGKKEDPEIENVDYGGPSRYQEVDPAPVTVSVEARSADGAAARSKTPAVIEQAQIEAGKAYTFVVAPGMEPGKHVHMIQVEDTVTASAARVPEEPATGKQPATQPQPDDDHELKPDVEKLREDQREQPPRQR